jgi:hypothetical protein
MRAVSALALPLPPTVAARCSRYQPEEQVVPSRRGKVRLRFTPGRLAESPPDPGRQVPLRRLLRAVSLRRLLRGVHGTLSTSSASGPEEIRSPCGLEGVGGSTSAGAVLGPRRASPAASSAARSLLGALDPPMDDAQSAGHARSSIGHRLPTTAREMHPREILVRSCAADEEVPASPASVELCDLMHVVAGARDNCVVMDFDPLDIADKGVAEAILKLQRQGYRSRPS